MRQLTPYAIIVAVTVAIDQSIKQLVEARMPMQQMFELLPFFALYRTYNTGVAFSMFSSSGDKVLIAVSLVVIAFMLYLASRTTREQWVARLGFALVVGGAFGNVIDRSIYGHVIDYFLFHTPYWSFAIFNMADVFITIGAGLVLLEEFLGWRRERLKGKKAS